MGLRLAAIKYGVDIFNKYEYNLSKEKENDEIFI